MSPFLVILNEDGVAIAESVETLWGASFNRPQHETVYDAIVVLNGRGALTDAVTVANELFNRQLLKLGGAHHAPTGA